MSHIWAVPNIRVAALRRYGAVIAVGNLVWEFAQMPLYTLWRTGTGGEITLAALHCTVGDVLIATASLGLASLLAGRPAWPRERFLAVAATAVALGLVYTVVSEWLNIEVRRTWAYADLMPRLPWLGTGLSPLAQWLVVPSLAFWASRRPLYAASAAVSLKNGTVP